ncbi:MAG: GTP diphosphokinase [Gammaproteobacteria bacterium]|nr:GTP diphosphokinase [Gammaproteobacteria bacterium]
MVYVDTRFVTREDATQEQVESWLRSLGFGPETADAEQIRRAFTVANQAHNHQQRASGEPYITHALAVAEILVQLRLDTDAIVAAILHDVVEDTGVKLAEIEQMFGVNVARLVDGVTKMGVIEQHDLNEKAGKERLRVENLRKLLLAMAEDVRVVLIKLADRLHNMRTLKHLPEEKQLRIARETADIFAPLANRLGIWQLKWELEDLAFRYLEPENYKKVALFLDERRVDRERYINNVILIIKSELRKAGVEAEVSGRPKHLCSIWRKMQRKGVDFHALHDVRAVRILVPRVQDCYAALGVIHTLWRHIPREFDDYIATPKENMYQSIHSAVIGPDGKTLEVQIRTHDMHKQAELGVAAHWTYKEGKRSDAGYEQKITWLRQLLEWKDESNDAGDFIDRFKSEVFQDRVYVITPQGDIIDLPQGATPLDFAYHIHTDVGHRCRGARVNGRMVQLTYELKNGEQVEIITTHHGQPSRDWLNPLLGYLKTSRARSKVQHWFKQQDHSLHIEMGREALDKDLRRIGIQGSNHSTLAEQLKFPNVEEFYAAYGRGDITTNQIAARGQVLVAPATPAKPPSGESVAKRSAINSTIQIQGVGNLLTHLGRCCSPAPGDTIVGFITRGRGVTIHRHDCRNIVHMDDEKRTRLITVEWGGGAPTETYSIDIRIDAIDRQGLLRDILTVLSNEKVNVTAVNTLSNKSDSTAQMNLTLEVTGVEQLNRVLTRLSQLNNIQEIRRMSRS